MKKYIVCGGRNFARPPNRDDPHYTAKLIRARREAHFLNTKLDELVGVCNDNFLGDDCIIVHGNAMGADAAADDWAVNSWKVLKKYEADWTRWPKAAGPIRNEQMLNEELDGLTAVVAFPGGRGTAHMVDIATKAGATVIQFTIEEVNQYIADHWSPH